MGKILIIGAGPGGAEDMTPRAAEAVRSCDVLCGYTLYVDLIRARFPETEGRKILTTPMGGELERCRMAMEEASAGRTVALVCSGDAGIYGMAGPVLEMEEQYPDAEVEIIPGLTAAVSGAALLGAPLMNDFCVISLSDLLTPWEVIVKRLRAAAAGDFTTVLYNPMSRKRRDHLRQACEIFLQERSGDTVCGWARNIGRPGEEHRILTLKELRDEQVDMFTTVFIGSSSTKRCGRHMVEPRGYRRPRVLLFGGTTEGRQMAQALSGNGFDTTVCVATAEGRKYLEQIPGIRILEGRRDAGRMAALMGEGYRLCIDATHPYAREATANIREACGRTGLAYYRLLRAESEETEDPEDPLVRYADSTGDACRLLEATEKQDPVLLLTGAKEAALFSPLIRERKDRVWCRILPTKESLALCRQAGLAEDHVITGYGPFTEEENARLMRAHGIRYMVTRDSGAQGGFPQKLAAARSCGVRTIVIRRPRESGYTAEELLRIIKEQEM